MNRIAVCGVVGLISLSSQTRPATPQKEPLHLVQKIALPNVKGRIDHFTSDATHNRVILAALGNNTVEVIDAAAERDIRSIAGASTPQGMVFVADLSKLFVANGGDGKLRIYDGASFKLITTVGIGEDADNVRYDAKQKLIFVAYGGEEQGGIAAVEAATGKRLPDVAKLDASKPVIYANIADQAKIAVIDKVTHKITEWPLRGAKANFPMALDEPDRRLFVATRHPARLIVLNLDTGAQVASLACVNDADDLYYDKQRKRIYIPGGEGFISVIEQSDPNHYRMLANVPTAEGARTALWSDTQERFYLAVPARYNRDAALWVYRPE
jgi:hypothetical protein